MRVTDDVRASVGFIGHGTDENSFRAVGTGFLVYHQGYTFFLTNAHIAFALGEDPYTIRFNGIKGEVVYVAVDPLDEGNEWLTPEDDAIDLAALHFNVDLRGLGCDIFHIHTDLLATDYVIKDYEIGVGNLCYVVGLFRLMAGKDKNLPFVHTGHIGMMAEPGSLVPTEDWRRPRSIVSIEAHLAEISSLRGLSGSPVFVRPSVTMGDFVSTTGGKIQTLNNQNKLFLLGIWQGAWEAPPDSIIAVERGNALRVPVGVGLVVPATKIIALLETEAAVRLRQNADEANKIRDAAKSD